MDLIFQYPVQELEDYIRSMLSRYGLVKHIIRKVLFKSSQVPSIQVEEFHRGNAREEYQRQ